MTMPQNRIAIMPATTETSMIRVHFYNMVTSYNIIFIIGAQFIKELTLLLEKKDLFYTYLDMLNHERQCRIHTTDQLLYMYTDGILKIC
jgi:hypothetical protein